ncbi:MAG TPA: LacI family DNA-binding transcriptional regulator [Pseudonocardiaceae bacterium]|nr:LacI family DNA-binding transcriptional regulator [Pseudonocardiaceae bacterium]
MRDVADLADVSITTVSHVVNNTRPVAADTRERVLAAIEATGYAGDAIARSLVTGGTRSLGVAVPLVADPHFAELLRAIEHEASERGYSLLFVDTHDEAGAEQAAVRTLRSRRVDGLLLSPSPTAATGLLPTLRQAGLPTVLVDRMPENTGTDQVGPENVQATSTLVRHLAERGHRRIALIGGPPELVTSAERVLGYRLGLGRAKLVWDPGLVLSSEPSTQAAIETARRLLIVPDPATAVIAGSSAALVGVLRAAREQDLKIGRELAVVGYHDVDWAELIDPPLTTMAVPVEAIGRTAVRMLLDRIAEPDRPARTVRMPPTLMHRRSCGCDL